MQRQDRQLLHILGNGHWLSGDNIRDTGHGIHLPESLVSVDHAIADPSKAWINAKDPQCELAGQGQFEFRAIARFIALKHLAEHLHNPITRVNLLQGIFAQSMA